MASPERGEERVILEPGETVSTLSGCQLTLAACVSVGILVWGAMEVREAVRDPAVWAWLHSYAVVGQLLEAVGLLLSAAVSVAPLLYVVLTHQTVAVTQDGISYRCRLRPPQDIAWRSVLRLEYAEKKHPLGRRGAYYSARLALALSRGGADDGDVTVSTSYRQRAGGARWRALRDTIVERAGLEGPRDAPAGEAEVYERPRW